MPPRTIHIPPGEHGFLPAEKRRSFDLPDFDPADTWESVRSRIAAHLAIAPACVVISIGGSQVQAKDLLTSVADFCANPAQGNKRRAKPKHDADAQISVQIVAAAKDAPVRYRRVEGATVPAPNAFLLSCGHSFASLPETGKADIVCPACGVVTRPTHRGRPGGVGSKNGTYADLGNHRVDHAATDLSKLHEMAQPPRCTGRRGECTLPATVQCNGVHCSHRLLCDRCFERHIPPDDRDGATPAQIEQWHPKAPLRREHCDAHQRMPYNGYCAQRQRLVCATCSGGAAHRDCNAYHVDGDKATALAAHVQKYRSDQVFALVHQLEDAVKETEDMLEENGTAWNQLVQRLQRERDEAKAAIDSQYEAILRTVQEGPITANVTSGLQRLEALDKARAQTSELAAEMMARDAVGPLHSLQLCLSQRLPNTALRVPGLVQQTLEVAYAPPQNVWTHNAYGYGYQYGYANGHHPQRQLPDINVGFDALDPQRASAMLPHPNGANQAAVYGGAAYADGVY